MKMSRIFEKTIKLRNYLFKYEFICRRNKTTNHWVSD